MKYLFLILSTLVISVLACAQPPDSLWSHTFGGSSYEYCHSVQQTTDGGYILGGHTMSYGAGYSDCWLVKTDTSGTEEWSRTFGGSAYDHCYSVQQTTDGGYILGGSTYSYGAGDRDFWLLKMDANGDTLWTRTFGGSSDDYCHSVQQTTDGGYILGGRTHSYGAGSADFWLVKTDVSGTEEWSNTFGGGGSDWFWSVQQTSDGGYILGGETRSYGAGWDDFWLVKTDSNGDSLWSRTFGGSSYDGCYSIQQATDGGYILGGYTESYGAGHRDFWLVKTDATGTEEWSRTFGGSSHEECQSVQQTSGGGYILGGYTESYGAGSDDFWLVKTDSNGDSLWSRTFGGSGWDNCFSVQQTSGGGYILGGNTSSYGAGTDDFWLVKTGPEVVHDPLSGWLSGTLGPGEYHVVDDIFVDEDSTLTLMPGTTFHFDSAYVFSIYGTLLAVGTETDSIIFTTDTTANPDRWRRLFFDFASSSGSQLAYCLIENAFATGGWGSNGGGVYCNYSSPTFAHCVIRNNEANFGGGVSCYNSSASFTNCTITGNTTGNDGGGMLFNASSSTLSDCIISDNTSGDDGGGVHCYNSSPDFTTCTFSGNTASGDGGGISCQGSSSPTLTNCDISDNSARYDGGGVYCNNSSLNLTDCTIRGNSSDSRSGGGISYQSSFSATLTNCDIRDNSAHHNGGGVSCSYSSPTFATCTIDSNSAGNNGGGLYCSNDSSPTLNNCTISDNTSAGNGGGLNCNSDSSPLVTDCIFRGNRTDWIGGGVYCAGSTAIFTRCTIFGNFSDDDAGGVFVDAASPVFTNCTISNNSAVDLDCGMYCQFSSPTLNSTIIAFSEGYGIWFWNSEESQMKYCDVFGNSDGNIVFGDNDPSNAPPGIGQLVTTNANDDSSDVYFNILLDPMFVDTSVNDYHLLEGSLCIDAGDPTLLPDSDGTVADIGVFYFPQTPPTYTLSPDSLDFGDVLYRTDSTLSFWIHNPTENPLHAAGIRVTDTLFFQAHPTSAQIPAQDSVEIELTFMPRRNISYLDSVQISFGGLDEVETVIVQGTGIYDCHVLDGAVSGTLSLDCSPYYVAGDVTLGENDTLIIEAGVEVIFDSYSQFIVNGLLLAIGTEQDSIKFTCDTLFNPDHWGGIRFMSAHDSCRMEYCVIEMGRADGDYPDHKAGGVFCESSSPVFVHCSIYNNWAESDGGGVYCHNQSTPTFTHCTISDNVTDRYGGGVYCSGSAPSFSNCTISDNIADGNGGALHCSNASPTFTDCIISDNAAGFNGGGVDLYGSSSSPSFTGCTVSGNIANNRGGGLHCSYSASATLENCTLHDNTTDDDGGGFYGSHSTSSFVGCTINNNSSGDEGGGIYGTYCSLAFTECTITDNASDDDGGGVFIRSDTSTTFIHCTISGNASVEGGGVYCFDSSPTFNSTIVTFSDGDGIFFNLSPECVFEYCDVYGSSVADIGFVDDDPSHGPAGIGELVLTNFNSDSCDTYYNIFLNPMFIDTAASDYNLLIGSPCIDAGDPELPYDPDSTITDIGAFYFHSNAPLPFDLLSPANGDTVDTLAVTMEWAASNDPDPGDSIAFYRVYIALDSTFSTGVDSQDVSATETIWEGLVDGQTYWWRVKAFDTQDKGTFSNQIWNFTSVASAISSEAVLLPTEFALHQNYPNPFNPTTTIRYDVKQSGLVSVKIFDILGREVATLVSGTIPAGFHTTVWDASSLPSGLYLCRMEAPGFEHTRKLVLLK